MTPASRSGDSTVPPRPGWERRSEKVAAVVARQIVRDIADRSLEPGTTLDSESAMLERYQVSRASLREALRILETHGLITIKPGPKGGPSVSQVDGHDFGRMSTLYFQVLGVRFSEVLQARLILEPFMARLAAERHDPDSEAELKDIVEQGNAAESDAEWLRLSDAFHSAVVGMSGNTLLDLLARSLKAIYTERVAGLLFPESERDQVRDIHMEITEAIIAGDGDTAATLMREHMEEFARNVAERYPNLMDEVVDWR